MKSSLVLLLTFATFLAIAELQPLAENDDESGVPENDDESAFPETSFAIEEIDHGQDDTMFTDGVWGFDGDLGKDSGPPTFMNSLDTSAFSHFASTGQDCNCQPSPEKTVYDGIQQPSCKDARHGDKRCVCVKHYLMDKYENWCGVCKMNFKIDKRRTKAMKVMNIGLKMMMAMKSMEAAFYSEGPPTFGMIQDSKPYGYGSKSPGLQGLRANNVFMDDMFSMMPKGGPPFQKDFFDKKMRSQSTPRYLKDFAVF